MKRRERRVEVGAQVGSSAGVAVAVNWIERLSEHMDRQKAIAIVLVALMVGSMIAGVALI